jgi:hypothetical protein
MINITYIYLITGIDNYPYTYPLVRRLDAIKLKKKKEEEET